MATNCPPRVTFIIRYNLTKSVFRHTITSDKSHYENVPFEIPGNWCWTTINDIAFVTKLAGFEYTKYIADNISKNDGIPLFKGKNVLNGEVVYEF